MFAILGAILFLVIAILSVLVALGLPLGEFTMGGQHKILPQKYRVMAIISVVIQLFASIIITLLINLLYNVNRELKIYR